MKRIVKRPEPRSFSEWKGLINDNYQPDWNDMPGDVKRLLHRQLIEEQGWICCYCNCEIGHQTSHVEHLEPRNWDGGQKTQYRDCQFEYDNLMSSCGRNRQRREPLHCGAAKGSWYDESLMVSPLSARCEQRFRYSADGCIREASHNDEAAKTTIRKLNLHLDKLNRMRKGAIDGALDNIDDLDSDDLRRLITGFSQPDQNGRYHPFCMAIAQVLNRLLPETAVYVNEKRS